MRKHFLSIKTIKKQILSINNSIESYFNKLKYFKSNYKKILLDREYRVFWGVGIVSLLTLVYFLMPTFYNKNIIQSEIKNQIFKNYDIDIKFNEKINYGLLPKPHFYTKNLSIINNKKDIGSIDTLKVFIGISDFFEYVAGSNTFDYCKPDPRHLTSVIEILNGEISKCIMIGDSETDANAGKNAGIPVILLEDGYTEKKTTEIYHNHLIKDFIGIEKIVSKYL